ncbi:MAG: alpha/beta hydrolase family protein [Kribbellaceae bacterium]
MTEDRSVLSRTAPDPDTVLAYGNHADQVVDIWYGDPGRALVVLLHGGFWRPEFDRRHLRPMALALRDLGFAVAAVEYRREPGRPDLTTGDVRQALESVPDLLETRHEAVVAGHSAGGHLALWALARPLDRVRGVLALAPVADLVAAEQLDLDGGAAVAFLGTAAADRPDLDPARLPTPQVPVTVVHGTADGRVPYAMTESYTANRPGVRVVTLDGVDHFALIDPVGPAWPQVVDELERLSHE